jgi:hypothetical protein
MQLSVMTPVPQTGRARFTSIIPIEVDCRNAKTGEDCSHRRPNNLLRRNLYTLSLSLSQLFDPMMIPVYLSLSLKYFLFPLIYSSASSFVVGNRPLTDTEWVD